MKNISPGCTTSYIHKYLNGTEYRELMRIYFSFKHNELLRFLNTHFLCAI